MPKKTLSAMIACTLGATISSQVFGSPEILPDGRVTFRLKAPEAKEVRLACEGVRDPRMVRDEQGVWSFTSPPLAPDIYSYSFSVDGGHVLDPGNPAQKYNIFNPESLLHIPGPATLPWEINDVPRGELHRHFYKSGVAGDERDFLVYTPPGYDPTAHRRYPVLYLLHGFSDTAISWTEAGRANVIMDNLIARGQAQPMIVVMPLGYGAPEILRSGWDALARKHLWETNVANFTLTLVDEVMPRVQKAYRVKTDRQDRAITGLSMGGAESLTTGLNHPELFAYVGAFSTGGLSTNWATVFPKLDGTANSQFQLIYMACGTEDHLITDNRKFHAWLDEKGIKHTWNETPGEHSYRVWRPFLADFAPRLFQKADAR